ncbi:MAG: hypothetical protein V2I66_14705 [Halieaceae bacterium]|jgi:hypothetical protein|nr:hypothetical protein [Halieaceae bacterium]
MATSGATDNLEVAMLPLSDGRQIMVPLQALAEVQQVNFAGRPAGDLGEFTWRGYELSIQSLDEVCGLPAPSPERLTTVGVFKADKDMDPPFRALAFSGTASPGRVEPSWLTTVDLPPEGVFVGATRLHNELYLIPDLPRMLYGAG